MSTISTATKMIIIGRKVRNELPRHGVQSLPSPPPKNPSRQTAQYGPCWLRLQKASEDRLTPPRHASLVWHASTLPLLELFGAFWPVVAAQAPHLLPRSVGQTELAHVGPVHVVVEGHGADALANGGAHGAVVGERE